MSVPEAVVLFAVLVDFVLCVVLFGIVPGIALWALTLAIATAVFLRDIRS